MCTLTTAQTQKLHSQIAEAQKILNDWDQIITKQHKQLDCCSNNYKQSCCQQKCQYSSQRQCQQTEECNETCQTQKVCSKKCCPLERLTQAVNKLNQTVQESKEKHHKEFLHELNTYSNYVDEKYKSIKSN